MVVKFTKEKTSYPLPIKSTRIAETLMTIITHFFQICHRVEL